MSCARYGFSAGTHMSLVNAVAVLGWPHRVVSDDAAIDHARGVIVTAWYRETHDDAFVMIDSDIEFTPDQLVSLVKRLERPEVDMVSAVYPARIGQTIIGVPLNINAAIPQDDSLVELKSAGLGCIAIRRSSIRRIVETMSMPLCNEADPTGALWPLFLPEVRDSRYYTEDGAFCLRSRDVGLRIWLDPKVFVKHLSNELPVTLSNMALVSQARDQAMNGVADH